MSAETDIAAAINEACDVEQSLAYRPARLANKIAFVTPADVWKEQEARFCGLSIGLDVYLIASTSDQVTSLAWLDAQSTILMNLAPIQLTADQVQASEVEAPFVFTGTDGSSFLACRLSYSRFTIGD